MQLQHRTGDPFLNFTRLKQELKSIHFPDDHLLLDSKAVHEGSPEVFLLMLHHLCTKYSKTLSSYFRDRKYDIFGSTNKLILSQPIHRRLHHVPFLFEVYRLLREEFNYVPSINIVTQFFHKGYAERKMMLVVDAIELCKKKLREIQHERKQHQKLPYPIVSFNPESTFCNPAVDPHCCRRFATAGWVDASSILSPSSSSMRSSSTCCSRYSSSDSMTTTSSRCRCRSRRCATTGVDRFYGDNYNYHGSTFASSSSSSSPSSLWGSTRSAPTPETRFSFWAPTSHLARTV